MGEMTSAERVLRVLRREEPDRIPHFEWIIDRRVRDAICPGATTEEFTLRMGLDAILTGPDYRKDPVGPGLVRHEWGMVMKDSGEEHAVAVEHPIQTMDDLRAYTPPDPHAPGRFASLDRVVRRYKGQLAIGVHLNDVLSIPRYLAGFQTLMMSLATEPELMVGLVDLSVDANIELAKEVAKRGADFVFTGDDYASADGPFMSPAMFREYLYPGLKRVMGAFNDLGLPVIKHSDGDLRPVLDMILDSGIDCLDPIDPMGGMSMAEMKRAYGDRIALKGNVNCAHTLALGTEKDVVEETIQVIRDAGHGGGLIASSSNSIHASVKPGNYLAMWNAIRCYGRYPLKLDGWEGSGAAEAFA
ncbi:MAG: uroporphyrinogen decarboxylase family protein [Planctomycetota bacterium]